MDQTLARELLDFIAASPSTFHVIDNFADMLRKAGCRELREEEPWTLEPGQRYFLTRNGSTLAAFRVPRELRGGFALAAAHSDSPTFKLKENPQRTAAGHYTQLCCEKYGGMLMSTWFDRPLSAAGRVLVRTGDGVETRLVNIDRDLAVIPNVAIHMNRAANDGMKYQANVDTYPLLGSAECGPGILALAAESAGAAEEDIVGHDLFLYCREKGTIFGAQEEYILSPKLDDLECAFALMKGFLSAEESGSLPVCCIFDNEEVGSGTRQGAASTLLRDTLRRIALGLGLGEERYLAMLAGSFLVSADNAHAQHPNHPEYSDSDNCPWPNGGVVIKYNANVRYATDGVSAAVFREICREAGVPVQRYANRSDLPGGSTLGSIAGTLVPVSTVDIGLAQLAMHSAVETGGVADLEYLVRAMEAYFSRTLALRAGKRCF